MERVLSNKIPIEYPYTYRIKDMTSAFEFCSKTLGEPSPLNRHWFISSNHIFFKNKADAEQFILSGGKYPKNPYINTVGDIQQDLERIWRDIFTTVKPISR